MNQLVITNLNVTVENKEILKGLSLTVPAGQVHAIMGPNGSGKSTLAATLMGHPKYEVTSGSVTYKEQDVLVMSPDDRSKLGLFLSFQYPPEVAGVSMGNFLRTALNARRTKPMAVPEFFAMMQDKMKTMGMNEDFITRGVNEGFSGGEKKRAEILQMAILQPSMCILDETDSGLDIDALRIVADGVNALRSPERGMLIITHYQRLLNYIKPDVVQVLIGGIIVKTGGPELAMELEKTGYEFVI
ncbi:MAG: Fe-S cluster assembly ATPase SufC [Patescibacteria group bacterium]